MKTDKEVRSILKGIGRETTNRLEREKEGTFQIDLTPTWRGLAPIMIELVGGNADTKEGQQNALAEFGRVFEMACNMATNHELHDIRTSARVLIFDLCEMVDRQNQRTKDKEGK